MSLLSPKQKYTILSPEQRRDIIRHNILNLNYTQLAQKCHCTKRTIKRDVQQWRREGGFEEFLMDEFFRSYPNIKEEFPEKAFDRLCYLLGRTLTRKIEAKTVEEIREIKLLWIKDERNNPDQV
jgi:transposase